MEPMQRTVRYQRVRSVNAAGFSLIELMVAVVIIAVISGIAYPWYRNHIISSNRAAIKSFMSNVAAREEQIMLDARAYSAAAATNVKLGAPINLGVPAEVAKYYSI